MAQNDYRRCDVCGSKAFSDDYLAYQYPDDEDSDEIIEDSDLVRGRDYKLMSLGDWAVLCRECAKTHKVAIIPISAIAN